jgi:putative ABC transport system permease protein
MEAIDKEIIIADTRFKVIGVLDSMGSGIAGGEMDRSVYIPITTAQEVFDIENLQNIMIKFTEEDRADEAKFRVKTTLLKTLKEDDFSVFNQGTLLSTISSILQVLTVALGGIAAISLLVGGIGIMNIMLVSVTERTREIGIRKSVGATNKDILTQFLVESIFLSLVGGSMGVILGILGTMVVGQLISANAFSLWSIILAFGVSALVGIIFGVAPAAKASRLDPVEALRYE